MRWLTAIHNTANSTLNSSTDSQQHSCSSERVHLSAESRHSLVQAIQVASSGAVRVHLSCTWHSYDYFISTIWSIKVNHTIQCVIYGRNEAILLQFVQQPDPCSLVRDIIVCVVNDHCKPLVCYLRWSHCLCSRSTFAIQHVGIIHGSHHDLSVNLIYPNELGNAFRRFVNLTQVHDV